MAFFRHSVLALRVLLWVLVASFAVFAVATAVGISLERDKVLQHAHLDAQNAATQSLPAISMSLWQYDMAGLNALLTGMVASNSVVRVEVLGPDQVVADVQQPGFSGSMDRVWTLPVLAQDQKTSIGTLRISESYASVNAQVTDTLTTLILTDLVKIVGLALVLFGIVCRKIARHLHRLALEVTRLGRADQGTELVLRRKKSGNYRDEIDILIDAINRFLIERQHADEALRIAACAFESQQGMAITDVQRVILRVNQAFTTITGYSADEAVGQTPRLLSSGRHDSSFYEEMTQSLEDSGLWQGEIWNRRKSGEVYPQWLSISAVKGSAGLTTHFVAIFSDVSERVKA